MPASPPHQDLRLAAGLPCPVTRITGVWRFTRTPHWSAHCRSTPGHLLHLVTAGSYSLQTNDRQYEVRRGDVIYYHEYEEVACIGHDEPVAFLSAGFLAPDLAPLPLDRRVFSASPAVRRQFHRLYAATAILDDTERGLAMFAALTALLSPLFATPATEKRGTGNHAVMGGSARPDDRPPAGRDPEIWWTIEQELRRARQFRTPLAELAGIGSSSPATVVRSCRRATGQSPLQRQCRLRLEEARGLLRHSTLSIAEIARHLGYPRIHEFSREFRHLTNTTPRQWRKTAE
jgi:AraC-like DNA-binding protein